MHRHAIITFHGREASLPSFVSLEQDSAARTRFRPALVSLTHVPFVYVDTRDDTVFEMLFQVCVSRGLVWRCRCRFTRLLRPAPLVEGNLADISFRGARNVSSRRCLSVSKEKAEGQECLGSQRTFGWIGSHVFFFESVSTNRSRACRLVPPLVPWSLVTIRFLFLFQRTIYQWTVALCAQKFNIVTQGNESGEENRIFLFT